MPNAKTTPRPIDPSFMGKAILVVEDHEDSRDLLAMSFRLIGARVFAVGSLTDAQRAFARHTPDLVVCDLKLPDGTGLEFVVWVRALAKGRGRDVPCIALTGFEESYLETEAFDAYLRKPVDLDRLCTTIQVVIARRRPS